MSDRLKEIEAREAVATPGPWEFWPIDAVAFAPFRPSDTQSDIPTTVDKRDQPGE
jgi:hypothetical protein